MRFLVLLLFFFVESGHLGAEDSLIVWKRGTWVKVCKNFLHCLHQFGVLKININIHTCQNQNLPQLARLLDSIRANKQVINGYRFSKLSLVLFCLQFFRMLSQLFEGTWFIG